MKKKSYKEKLEELTKKLEKEYIKLSDEGRDYLKLAIAAIRGYLKLGNLNKAEEISNKLLLERKKFSISIPYIEGGYYDPFYIKSQLEDTGVSYDKNKFIQALKNTEIRIYESKLEDIVEFDNKLQKEGLNKVERRNIFLKLYKEQESNIKYDYAYKIIQENLPYNVLAHFLNIAGTDFTKKNLEKLLMKFPHAWNYEKFKDEILEYAKKEGLNEEIIKDIIMNTAKKLSPPNAYHLVDYMSKLISFESDFVIQIISNYLNEEKTLGWNYYKIQEEPIFKGIKNDPKTIKLLERSAKNELEKTLDYQALHSIIQYGKKHFGWNPKSEWIQQKLKQTLKYEIDNMYFNEAIKFAEKYQLLAQEEIKELTEYAEIKKELKID